MCSDTLVVKLEVKLQTFQDAHPCNYTQQDLRREHLRFLAGMMLLYDKVYHGSFDSVRLNSMVITES